MRCGPGLPCWIRSQSILSPENLKRMDSSRPPSYSSRAPIMSGGLSPEKDIKDVSKPDTAKLSDGSAWPFSSSGYEPVPVSDEGVADVAKAKSLV